MTFHPALGPALALALILAPCRGAQGRIGETIADCTQRYGPPRAALPAVITESDPEALRFDHDGFSVIVHFHKGVAWHISYARGYISDPDRRRLLAENVTAGDWEPPNGELIGNVFLWRHRPADLVACGISNKNLYTLEVMTRSCSEAFGRARARRHEDAVTGLSAAAARHPEVASGPAH